jgi:hypothetical protein
MKSTLLITLTIAILLSSCWIYPAQPYHGKITCSLQQRECQYQFRPGVNLSVRYVDFNSVAGTSKAYVTCWIKNQSDKRMVLHTSEFALLSSKGFVYLPRIRVDTIGVNKNDSTGFSFGYAIKGHLRHKTFDSNLRGDTVYFVRTSGSMRDTICKAVSDMVRRNYY